MPIDYSKLSGLELRKIADLFWAMGHKETSTTFHDLARSKEKEELKIGRKDDR